jgi:hypothetical protein
MLGGLEEALRSPDSQVVGFSQQVGVHDPVAQVPVTDPFIAGAIPALPQAAWRRVFAQFGPVNIRHDAPDDREGRHAGQRCQRNDREDTGMAATEISLRAGARRRGKRFGSATRGEQYIASKAGDEQRLAAKEQDGRVVATQRSVGLDGRHFEVVDVKVSG